MRVSYITYNDYLEMLHLFHNTVRCIDTIHLPALQQTNVIIVLRRKCCRAFFKLHVDIFSS